MGGYVAACYVDWSIVHSPLETVIDLFERYRQLDPSVVQNFIRDSVINNDMQDRDTLEDGSKIFHLVNELEFESMLFTPQIIHEPWADRYRVHPGSGRATALWLCGYERFKTIYTHFDERGFAPPGYALKIHTSRDLASECIGEISMTPVYLDFETYYAFPTDRVEICRTKNMDSVWDYTQVDTLMPWRFMRYSEGRDFLKYKQAWRHAAWPLWTELQQPQVLIGDTVFEFDDNGKIVAITRKGQPIDVDKSDSIS